MKKCTTFNELINEVFNKLTELGYNPCFYDESKMQLDCVINESLFSIYGDDEDETTLGFGLIFEAKEILTPEEIGEIKNLFLKEESPFDNLLFDSEMFNDLGLNCIHLVSECTVENFTNYLLDDIITSINKNDGIVELIKTKSYLA